MKASCNWLNELTGIGASASEFAERFTRAGLEVEGIERVGAGLEQVVVAEVRARRAHPTKEKLSLVTVFDGKGEREVVCGAPNVPAPGARVVLADVGAVLPSGLAIAPKEIAGVRSVGMLASERELGVGPDHEGIFVLGDDELGKPGVPIATALALEDAILDIALTPNRPDCLGHLGLARELSVLFDTPFAPHLRLVPSKLLSSMPELPNGSRGLELVERVEGHSGDTTSLVTPIEGAPLATPIHITAPDRCSRYVGTVLQRARVAPSPFWVRYRLHVLGQRSIDRVVDVTNWILLELGHPIHAFDADRIRGQRIEVRLARRGERIALLDGTERELTEDDLVIADVDRPIALAGVMGGAESAVRAETTNLLLEVAHFDPRSVRRTARRHAIHTESSHRFERGVDAGAIATVTRRAVALLADLAGAAAAPVGVDATARHLTREAITMEPGFVRDAIGDPSITNVEARRILEGLGCVISPGEDHGWRVIAPSHRTDLLRPIDLVEEVARVRGYDRVPTLLFRPEPRAERANVRALSVRRVRAAARAAGYHEAVNFTFLSRTDLERAEAPLDLVALANPLSDERAVMRTAIVPSLLANVSRAERYQRPRGRIFEIGKRYRASEGPTGAEESLGIGFVAFGARDAWLGEGAPVDFYDAKGAIEHLARALGLAIAFAPSAAPPGWLHPRRAAELLFGGEPIGHAGEIHPDVADAHALASRPVLAELTLEPLLAALEAASPRSIAPLPRFQAVVRDLAIVVAEEVTFDAVLGVARRIGAPLVEDVALFDVYRGKPIAAGEKSFALRLSYRDPDATLTDARVEGIQAAILAELTSALGATLRA